jgi:hypothetical protein
MLCDGVQKPQKLKMSVITLRAVEPLCPPHSQVWSMAIPGSIWCVSAGNNCNPNTRAAGESA